jgi:xeroderma pigmentosum group C-complementing protein
VEAFNEAFQKWVVIDPMVTKTLAKPHKLEPPATDPYNLLSYVVAFEEDASARDVTRRYTKVFNAKIRKNRVESTKNGEVWWGRVLRFFEKPFLEDRDEVEIGELTAKTASEPMPRNVQDFKDHPIYALERHLRRNEVIFPKRVTGHVSLGKSGAKSPTTEPVYRRSDVHVLRSANKWYRLGRDIKLGEQALKRIPARSKAVNIDDDEDADMAEETALYAFFQTEVYKPPPVVKGRIPKNAYGNLDVYVPSMVPPGGVHIPHAEAARAARTLGIDYADAVTGFNFKGRHGTAVFNGVVVASEYKEAVVEVIRCFEDEKLQDEQEQRAAEVLRLWKHFLLKLRIAERVKGYVVEGEADEKDNSTGIEQSDVEEMGGGFLPESDDEMAHQPEHMGLKGMDMPADEVGGGFLPESDDDYGDGGSSTADNLDRLHSNTKGKDPLLAVPDDLTGGGFIPDTLYRNPKLNHSPRTSRPKYSLIVVPRQTPDNTTTHTKPDPATQSWLHERIAPGTSAAAAISVASSVNDSASAPASASASVTAEPPIVVDSSVNDSASPSVEMLSRAPSQTQSRAPSESVEVVSPQSEDNEGSLLSEDPEDEDAVPEWLMSD